MNNAWLQGVHSFRKRLGSYMSTIVSDTRTFGTTPLYIRSKPACAAAMNELERVGNDDESRAANLAERK